MILAEVIKRKRRGEVLTDEEIHKFVLGYVQGEVADYQMSALMMAIFFKGMNKFETTTLTQAMLHSGKVVNLADISGSKIDKHSTGGVGDKTSLIIGPLVAAAGVRVPMISGRGLGHTGGTLDKLESIPGFSTKFSIDQFKKQVGELGLCFIGQTEDICPADKKMYALRDVTGTVECIPLICASIMSKKLAEGIDGLVLDIKVGSGAFMKSLKDARTLAKCLCEIARQSGLLVKALITNMDQPLGLAVGNALEVQECLDVLQGGGPEDLRKLSLELSAQMILLGKKEKTLAAARKLAEKLLVSGAAMQKFAEIVKAQGGDLQNLPVASKKFEIISAKKGYVSKLDSEKIGLAALSLGAGRLKTTDEIDPSAGIVVNKKIGDKVQKGESLVTFHFSESRETSEAEKLVRESYEIRLQKRKPSRLIMSV